MNDEHEILSHKLIEDLKYDVEALKKKLSEPETATHELIAEMEELKSTVKELNNIFKEALQDIQEEDSNKLLTTLQNKIEAVTTQNETIARGMVAISDKLEEFMRGSPRPMGPSRMPPPPLPPHLTHRAPPPGMLPPEKPKREGIFK